MSAPFPSAAAAAVSTDPLLGSADAIHALCAQIEDQMDELITLIETETDLVREGKLMSAGDLQPRKAELVAGYMRDMQRVKANATAIGRIAGHRAERLRQRHVEFRSMLQINMAVLATAREVAEDIIRTAAASVGAQTRPSTYGPAGAPAVEPQQKISIRGLAVDRSL
jgi:hypothetical protein